MILVIFWHCKSSFIDNVGIPIKRFLQVIQVTTYLLLVKASKTMFKQTNDTYIFKKCVTLITGGTNKVIESKHLDQLVKEYRDAPTKGT